MKRGTDENGLEVIYYKEADFRWPEEGQALYAVTPEPTDDVDQAIYDGWNEAFVMASKLAGEGKPQWVTVWCWIGFDEDNDDEDTYIRLRATHVPNAIDDKLEEWEVDKEQVLKYAEGKRAAASPAAAVGSGCLVPTLIITAALLCAGYLVACNW